NISSTIRVRLRSVLRSAMTTGFRQAEFRFGPDPREAALSRAERHAPKLPVDLGQESLPSAPPESALEAGPDAASRGRKLPPEPSPSAGGAAGPAELWRSLGPKDRFAVPPRRFSGEVGPEV